jgi:pyruvate/2-oxoglutarate dehydrogenase complex dihydrolipoamide dehydrogenase (E3) component
MGRDASESFDLIVIGAGQAGPFLAARLVAAGRRVALVEARDLGGTCVNRGCTPTKTLRKSARVAHMARRAAEFGVRVGDVTVDFAAAMDRMQLRVDQSRAGLASWLGGMDGLTLVKAHARLAGRSATGFRVETDGPAGKRHLEAPHIVLNTGTRPFVPPIAGLRELPYLDNESLLALRQRPEHLVVIGGSYIGLEMAQIFRRLGSDVSVVEAGPRVAAREDADVSEALADLMRDEGITLHLGSAIESAIESASAAARGVSLNLANGSSVQGSHVLVATGRTPNTDDLGLDSVGLATDARGYIATDGEFRTAVSGIWALGDINGRGAFTHTSYHDSDILGENLLAEPGAPRRSADVRHMAYAMFTDPPLGHVGINEADARKLVAQGRRISQAVMRMKDVSRAKEESETSGLIKLLIDEDSGCFVGASMLGINADEVVQVVGQAMAAGATWQTVRNALPIHPTVTEFLPTIIDRRQPLSAP